ncbi:MAG: tape measure protein [Paracoccus sp. (in: a-proteobacteria)]|nr:tape measure protein [Paracoccus sp. (in: a-proteobacteria)]
MTEMRAKFTFTADAGEVKRALKEMDGGLSAVRGQTQTTASVTRDLGVAGRTAASGLNASTGAAGHLGRASETAARGIRQQTEASRKAARAIDLQTRAANTGIAALTRLGRMAVTAGAGIAAAFSVQMLGRAADGWSDMQSRLGAAIKDQAAAPEMMQDMLRLANASYSGIGQTVEIFAGNVGPMRDLGYATKETVDYTESLNHMLVITATKGQQAASVQTALSKAMATGKLQADGLETVLAHGGRVAEALAKELGTTVSNLRGLASQGQITGRVIAQALLGSLEDVRREAGEMPTTIADGFLKIGNSVTALIGSIDKGIGASEAVAGWLNGISEGIATLAQSDFSGHVASMAAGAQALGQVLMVLAATRIPAIIAGARALNISMAVMQGQFLAGAIASRGITAAMAVQAAGARALAGAMALAGGPVGILAAAVAGLGVALWNTRSRAEEVAAAMSQVAVSQRDLNDALERYQHNRSAATIEALRDSAEAARDKIREALKAAQDEFNNASFSTNLFGRSLWETDRMAEARAQIGELQIALHDAEGALSLAEHAASNMRHQLEGAGEAARILTEEQERAQVAALDMLRSYERRAELALAEAEYGRESVGYQVVQMAHERELLAARVNSLDISESLRDAILDAADAAMQAEGATDGWDQVMNVLLTTTQDTYNILQDIAATEPPGNWLEGAIGQAQRLALALWEGLGAAGAIAGEEVAKPPAAERPPARPPGIRRPSRRAAERSGGGASRGGGIDHAAREAEQQRRAVANLTAGLQQELDILRELDPALQDMIRHRDVLAHATAAEKQSIEEMIRTRLAETEVMEEAQRQMREVQATGREVIGGIFDMMRNGSTAGDILLGTLGRIAGKLAEIAQDNLADLLFGNGKTGGGTGIGGILGSVFGAIRGLKANAMGDVIGAPTLFAYGDRPGQLGVMGEAGAEAIMPLTHAMGGGVGARIGGRETTLPLTRLASGKLGVTATPDILAAARPFAAGGTFGLPSRPPLRGASAPAAPAGGSDMRVHMSFDLRGAEGDVSIERKIGRAVAAAQQEMQRMLPDQVKVILADPRAR